MPGLLLLQFSRVGLEVLQDFAASKLKNGYYNYPNENSSRHLTGLKANGVPDRECAVFSGFLAPHTEKCPVFSNYLVIKFSRCHTTAV